jgi:hypothetical protein
MTSFRTRQRQAGAAALIVVMVLFFIASMVAAYASRNMIFEQRTGTNLFRATQALEAAEAGMDWAITMLNQGRIDEQCVASTETTDNSFRERYLSINTTSAHITAVTQSDGSQLTPTCVFDPDTGRWTCSCPVDDDPDLDAPTSTAPAPAFRVRFRTPTTGAAPGLVRIEVVGCTRLEDNCLVMSDEGVVNEGRVQVSSLAFLAGRSLALPRAALTVRGDVTAPSLSVSNTRVEDGGLTVHASGSINPGLALTTLAGNALDSSTIEDPLLSLPELGELDERERFFIGVFQLPPDRWRQQQAYIEIDCGVGNCTAAQVREAQAALPGRPIWVAGDLDINSAGDIGTATAPVTVIVDGQVLISTPGVRLFGLLVVRPADVVAGWTVSNSATVVGALVVDGTITGGGALNVAYDGEVLTALKATHGSFIRAPGTWHDWRAP